jgi:hypothetical protein
LATLSNASHETASSDHSASELPLPNSSSRMLTRSQTGHSKPRIFPDFELHYTTRHPLQALHAGVVISEPHTYVQATVIPEWHAAMTNEFQALLKNETWSLCPRPPGKNVVPCKWVFKLKRRPDGSIDRHKARLVAVGYLQRSGIDFHDTFSPVIKPSTVRMVLATAVSFNWNIRQLDVSNAFLHGILEDEVYMAQPKGFEDPVHPQFVCKLHKSLYGLKQAPRAWFNRLSTALLSLGFLSSQVDPSLFIYHQNSVHAFLLVYVDDILVTSNDQRFITSLISNLQLEFAMKDLGQLTYFLGIEATRNSSGLHLRQTRYIIDLLNRVRLLGICPYRAPCVSGSKLSKFDGELLPDPSEYSQTVGALQYVTLTRPDIAYSVNQLCQHMQAPTSTHWTAAKRVLRYLKHTLDYGLFYKLGSFYVNAYCDSDWAGDPDNRRSTCGYGVYVGPNLISWSAKKQPIVSKSSTEAEYRCLALVTAEVYWLRMLLCELQISLESAPIIWCDNVSALAIASNPIFHARSKHIEVDYHFVREKVTNRDIILQHVPSSLQPADIFTKGYTADRFCFLRDKLSVLDLPASLRGNDKDKDQHHHTQSPL